MDLRVILSDHERVIQRVASMSFSKTGELELWGPLSEELGTFTAPWKLEPAWTDVTVTLPASDDPAPLPPGRAIVPGICSCCPIKIPNQAKLEAVLESILKERGLKLPPKP